MYVQTSTMDDRYWKTNINVTRVLNGGRPGFTCRVDNHFSEKNPRSATVLLYSIVLLQWGDILSGGAFLFPCKTICSLLNYVIISKFYNNRLLIQENTCKYKWNSTFRNNSRRWREKNIATIHLCWILLSCSFLLFWKRIHAWNLVKMILNPKEKIGL